MSYPLNIPALILVFFCLLFVALLVYNLGEAVHTAAEQARIAHLTALRRESQERQREEAAWKEWADAVEQEPHAFKEHSL